MRIDADHNAIKLLSARDNPTGTAMVRSLLNNQRPDWAEEREPNLYRFTWNKDWDIYFSVDESQPETVIKVTAVEVD